jgi:hypothetical protein
MAITETNLPGNGTAGPFTYTFPALEAGDIYVSVDGVVKTVTTDYSLNFVDKQITFLTTPYPTVSNVIRIYRVTDDADLAATFYSGAAIRATDLNTNFTQGLYVTQESNREAATAISTAGGAVTTANAATATANSAVSTANAATATANTALSNSSAAVSTANTASSNASAAVSTANTASSNATTAVSTANAATATANSAASDAATAISTANSALSTANTASTTATNAVNTANSASSAASSAVSTANTASSNASAAVSTANTASSNATSAVNTANSALSTANAAASAVANAILYDIVANVAAIPALPANNDAVEVTDSTGIESFTPLTSIPGGFAGNSGLSVRIVYTTTGNTWTWIQYFPNDPETRYLKEAVTTSDTAPVSPSDGDLWYDSVGGRTYVYYDDGAGSQWVDTSPQGSGVSDAISEGDTSAEVIDTGSDGRFVVTTEGTERLRVDASGRLGIGTTNPAYKCDIDVTGSALRLNSTTSQALLVISSDDAANAKIEFGDESDNDRGAITYDNPNNALIFQANAAERLRIDSSGRLGIGTNQPVGQTYIAGPNTSNFGVAADAALNIAAASGALANRIINLNFAVVPSATNAVAAIGMAYGSQSGFGNGHLIFGTRSVTTDTAPTERLRITSAGLVGIGTSAPSTPLEVAGAVGSGVISDYLSLYYPQSYGGGGSGPRMLFKANDIAGTKSTYAGIWSLLHANTVGAHSGKLVFGTTSGGNLVERLRIDESGNVGIGTANPVVPGLTIESAASTQGIELATDTGFAAGPTIRGYYRTGSSYRPLGITGSQVIFGIQDVEKARLDASGRLLVGTSTSPSLTDGQYSKLHVVGNTNSANGDGIINIGRGVLASSGLAAGTSLGNLQFTDSAGAVHAVIGGLTDATTGSNDYPGRLVFSTTADGASSPTERMRITRGGDLFSLNSDNGIVSRSTLPAGTANTIFAGQHSATSIISGTNCFRVYTNGNVQNTNNSYGALSDIKLKENIVDATSQWNDLKSLQVRNYNFKEGQTHTQIGLVAQEVELVSPGLVTESPDRDEDGNDLGTVTKSVNYSVLYMKAVKALQEAMTRIETLEATNASLEARLTALEGGTN